MRTRAAALLELVGVFVVGTILARLAASALGISAQGLRNLECGASPEFLPLAASTAANLLLRYGLILGLAFAIGWWHRRRTPASYGVTVAGMPLWQQALAGLVLFAVAGFPPRLIMFLREHVDLGASPPHWELIEPRAEVAYWVYMAVGSFVLVPILEELFARGYVQTRLGEDFGPAAAIVMTAMMFALSHRQYFLASAVGVGMIAALLFSSILGGYVRYRFGSLLPVIVAHCLGNVPIRGAVQVGVLIAMVVVMVIARRAIGSHLREAYALVVRREVLVPAGLVIVTVAVILAIAAVSRAALLPVGAAALLAALALERQRTVAPFSTSSSRSTDR